ncbi:hypothetical protein EVA_05848 [gut metagenome]|uniref:Uncharacterized protein n=1 Tax=gut metagenome TaxID=749906 RepID=J9D0I0_9ZZZZ
MSFQTHTFNFHKQLRSILTNQKIALITLQVRWLNPKDKS